MVYYSIQISDKRSILWCDECWYESCPDRNFVFTKDEVETIVKQMREHYVYHLTVIGQDGSEETYDYGKKSLKPCKKKDAVTVEKNITEDFDLALF